MVTMGGRISSTRSRSWAVMGLGAIIAAMSMEPMNHELAAHEANLAAVDRSLERPLALPTVGELVGLDEERAGELLGPAASIETRAPANIWHYASSRCELDLVFYMEMGSGRMRILHYDFKRGADTAAEQQACLLTIARGDLKDLQPLIEWPQLPEQNVTTEMSEIGPAPAPMVQTQARTSELKLRRAEVHQQTRRYYRPRRLTTAWGYAASLRYSRPPYADSALISGWSGGRFGPAPYSSSGP